MSAENAPLMKYILGDLGLLDMLLFEQKVSLSEPNFVSLTTNTDCILLNTLTLNLLFFS